MAASPAQAPPDPRGAHLVLYDGVCGLCNHLVQFLLRHDRRAVFTFASLQSATGRHLVPHHEATPDELTTFYVVANYRTADARPFTRSDAALFAAGELDWPLRLMRSARLVPRPLRDSLYDIVARSRYRVFGRKGQCMLPRPEFRSRFLD